MKLQTAIDLPLWIILIPLIFILFYGVSVCKKGEWHEDSLSLTHSKDILGYFALMIVIHHTVQYLIQTKEINVGIMSVFENLGVCFVGGFFFFSGYGLVTSLHSKKGYLDNFIEKRLVKIIIPFYVVNTFFTVVLYAKGMIEKYELTNCFIGIYMANDHMWYLIEITILYILFYFNFKKSETEEIAFIKMFAQIVGIIIIGVILGHGALWFQGEWWYNSTILFFIGMIIARFENPVKAFVKRNYRMLISIFACLFLVLHFLTVSIIEEEGGYWTEFAGISWIESVLDKFETLAVQMPMIICFVLLVLIIGLKVKVKNRILSFLGTISLELYITHRLCIWVFEWIKSPFLYLSVVILSSLILGTVFYYIIKVMNKAIPKFIVILIEAFKKIISVLGKLVSKPADMISLNKYSKWGVFFITPFILFYMVFSFIPLASTIINSFFENYRAGLKQVGPTFVGFSNYEKLFASGDFWQYLGNTMLLWILVFIPQMVVSLLLAFWFSDRSLKIRGAGIYKTLIFLPHLIMATAFASLFATLFSTVGPINDFMVDVLKIWPERVSFFSNIGTTRGLIVFMNFLMWFGNSTLLLMAGMMNIDVSLLEAARVDGARPGTIFRKITIPLIRPVLVYVVITSLISGVELFDVPFVLTEGSGNPVRSSFTVVMFLNNHLFSKNYGMAGAISTLMFLFTGVLSVIVFAFNAKGEKR